MATTQSNPTPNPAPQPRKTEKKPKLSPIAIVAIVVLLALNAGLWYGFMQRGKDNAELTAQVDETTQLKAQVEQQYYEALSELEEMRSDNEEMNALIEEQKLALKEQKEKIEGLLRDSRNLTKARAELQNLRSQMEGYVAELNQLREQNAQLAAQNNQLSYERDSLGQGLEEARFNNTQLASERAVLVAEKEELTSTTRQLQRKVTAASVIKASNLEVSGQKERRSGRFVNRRNADNVDQIQICFNTQANEVAEPGEEQFFIRIISPQGETLNVEALGSGIFTTAAGETLPYTTQESFVYDQSANSLCSFWAPGTPFSSGDYKIEIYNKGHLAGQTTLTLK
jgi:myosin heavy subunit